MKPVLIAVSLLLFFSLSGQAQSNTEPQTPGITKNPSPNPPNYTVLKDGQKIYSTHLRLRRDASANKYLLLDSDQHIPIENVDRFHSVLGTFVTVPGSAGTDIYRVEREGPKISLYSKLFIDPSAVNDSGYTPTREFFFRKAEQEKMKAVTAASLTNALADNPASLRQLSIAKTTTRVGISTTLTGMIIGVIGGFITVKGHSHQEIFQPTVPPGFPQFPPLQTTVTTHPVSPLVYIGGGGIIGGLILIFNANHHALKAFDIYNQ